METTKEKKLYDKIDSTILKSLPNPTTESYEAKIKIPECTFYADKKIIELKSLKQYVYQLRDIVVSYERLINIVYEDLMKTYEPERLRIVMVCNPRGGISSKLTIDSDWGIRGGQEKFKDWTLSEDTWEVRM